MLEGVFNVAMPGLVAAFLCWWGVMEGLRNTLGQKQKEREEGALKKLSEWLRIRGCEAGIEELKDKVIEVSLVFRGVPDELGALAMSRERSFVPIGCAAAVIGLCLVAEMGIGLGTFHKDGARAVSLLACWLAIGFEMLTVALVARAGHDFRWTEALRSLARP